MRYKRKIKRKNTKEWLIKQVPFGIWGRDNENTGLAIFKKIAHSLIKTTANQVDGVAERRIQRVITQSRK